MDVVLKYADRASAGQKLVDKIPSEWGIDAIWGVANGGVVVAGEVARILNKRLEVSFSAKLPLPWNPEVAIGVVTVGGKIITNQGMYRKIGMSYMELQKITRERYSFLKRRHDNIISEDILKPLDCRDKNVLIIDDGIATGYTVIGTVRDIKSQQPSSIYLATPVIHSDALNRLKKNFSDIIGLIVSESRVFSVSSYYRSFPQIGDRQVRDILKENRQL
jgi:putative phosphoribosyl transferase